MNWRVLIRRSSSIVLWTGILLFLLMLWSNGEPGDVPLILVVLGATGLVLSRPRTGPD